MTETEDEKKKKDAEDDGTADDDEDYTRTVSSGYTDTEIADTISQGLAGYSAKKYENKSTIIKDGYGNKKVVEHDNFTCDKVLIDTPYIYVNGQPFKVKLGFTATHDVKINETRLHSGFENSNKAAMKHLYFQGDAGLTIEMTLIIRVDDEYVGEDTDNRWKGKTVITVLSDWVKEFQLCYVECKSPIIENNYYRITKFAPKQVYDEVVDADITFVQDTYNYDSELMSKTRKSGVKSNLLTQSIATDSSETQNNVNGGTTTTLTGTALALSKCTSDLYQHCSCTTFKKKNCTTKERVACVVTLQQALQKCGYYKNGKIDGLFCYLTDDAVRKFQKAYTKVKLKVDGVVGPITRQAIINKLPKDK